MNFRKIRYKISVIDTNYAEVSLHEADKGHTIPRFYDVSSLCRCGRIRARILITLRHIQCIKYLQGRIQDFIKGGVSIINQNVQFIKINDINIT